MTVTWEELRTDILERLDQPPDPADGFWSDDQLRLFANEGLRDVARRIKNIRATQDYATVADQSDYDMPDDMIQAYKVEYRTTSTGPIYALEHTPYDEDWGASRYSGTPVSWSTLGAPGVGGVFKVFPAPSEEIDGGLRIYYYRLPRKIEELDDPVEIYSGWEDIIALYVEWNARRKEAVDNKWRDAAQLYEARLEEMKMATSRVSDQPQHMSQAGTVGAWWVGSGEDW